MHSSPALTLLRNLDMYRDLTPPLLRRAYRPKILHLPIYSFRI
jgi:hypothetical protein